MTIQSRRRTHTLKDLSSTSMPTLCERLHWLRMKRDDDGKMPCTVVALIKEIETEISWRQIKGE